MHEIVFLFVIVEYKVFFYIVAYLQCSILLILFFVDKFFYKVF